MNIVRMMEDARKDERKRIGIMLDTVMNTIFESDHLPHNVPSDLPVTDVILDVLTTVSRGLATGISVNAFEYLYPKNPDMNATQIETGLNKTISDLMGIADLPRTTSLYECQELRTGILQAASDLRGLREHVVRPEPVIDTQEVASVFNRAISKIERVAASPDVTTAGAHKLWHETNYLRESRDHICGFEPDPCSIESRMRHRARECVNAAREFVTWDGDISLYTECPRCKLYTVDFKRQQCYHVDCRWPELPKSIDLSALKEHLDDYPVDPSVQEGLDQATRGELVAEPDLSATEASDVAVHILEGRSEEEVFAIVDEVCKRLRPKPIGVSYLLGISTPPSYIDMVRKHHQRAWEAVSDEIWAKSEPDNQYGIPYFIDTAAEPPEPPKDWDGYIKLRVNSKTGLESVQPAYFEPLVRRMMHDNTWMSGSNICDLRTGKSYYLEIVFTDDDGAVTARRTV